MIVGVHADPALHRIPGGVGAYVSHLVRELLERPKDLDCRMIVSRNAEAPSEWDAGRVLRTSLPVAPQYLLWNYLSRPAIPRFLDVVHATGLAIPPSQAPLVATVHDLAVETMPEVVPNPWRAIYRRGLGRALDQARVICAVSRAVGEEIVRRYGTDQQRIVVTPEAPGITAADERDASVFDRLKIRPPYVLNVGTVEPRKNQVALLRAVSHSRALDQVSVVIAGAPGWGRGAVVGEIAKLRLSERVTLTGKVTRGELAALYAGAAVFAFPSLYEGFGLPLLEALDFGIPSVAASIPALLEVAGSAALFVEPDDVAQLAEALVRLVEDANLRSELSEAGPRQASMFTWRATADATVSAYKRAAGAGE